MKFGHQLLVDEIISSHGTRALNAVVESIESEVRVEERRTASECSC